MRMPNPFRLIMVVALAACASEDDAPPAAERAEASRAVVVEERDGIWLDSAGTRRRLTAMRVGAYDHDSLAAKQREGEVILYWAAAPTLSPDARRVAYATNREAVAADARGQSIWLLDLATGEERALLHEPGRSYRPVGWLGDDVVFIGDEPGVWTIDPSTGARTSISSGTWLAVASNGHAVAVADDVPANPVVQVVTPTGTLDVPAAPDGMVYLAQAAFDSTAAQLLLEGTPDSGYTRRRFAYDLASGRLEPID